MAMSTTWAPTGELEQAGCDRQRLEAAVALLDEAVAAGFVPGCAAAVHHRGSAMCVSHGGALDPQHPHGSAGVERDTIFLIASLTKPIVCAGALLLVERGRLALDASVRELIPEFRDGLKDDVKLLHLFTHTSGLYDQIPRSVELRRGQRPIADYVQAVCETDLRFAPGTRVSYQSMGMLLIGEIVERLTGERLRDYLRRELFEPLGMTQTTLGMPADGMRRTARSLDVPFPAHSNDVGDDWNTDYWRDFGAPWGGMHSTVDDLAAFLAHMLGASPGPLSPALRRAMTRDQIAPMPTLSPPDKLANRWGLGWRLAAPAFGSLVSGDTFGHTGATGTMCWADPVTGLSCVLLTNQPRLSRDPDPAFARLPARFSNAVAAAMVGSAVNPQR